MAILIFSLLLSSVLLTIGIYCVVAQKLRLPTFAVTRSALHLTKQDNKKSSQLDALVFSLAEQISNFLHLDDYKRRRLSAELKSINISLSPEVWLARIYVKSALYLIPGMFLIPVTPIFLLLFAIVGVQTMYKEMKSIEIQMKNKRDGIEADLPRFTATIAQELKNTRNVLSIFEGYVDSAGKEFQKELAITISDMRYGSQETALIRFKSRVGSSMLSNVISGLQAVLRGDDGIQYFTLLAHDFKQIELQKLKLEAAKRPAKVRKYSGLLLICFILTWAVVIISQIISSMSLFQL